MSAYHLFPPDEPERRRPRQMLLGALLLMLCVGLIGGAIFGLRGVGLPFGPTPTVTATPAGVRTATPDFRATRFAEDQTTAVAYYAKATLQTPVSINMPVIGGPAQDTPTPVNDSPLAPPDGVAGDATATPIGASPLDPTAIALATLAFTPPPVNLPIVGNQTSPLATPPLLLPTDTPTATPLPVDAPPSTPTQPPTPTPTPTPYIVASLRANVRQNVTPAPLRQAPILSSASLGTLVNGNPITLIGRDETGEWVADKDGRWLRQAHITINGNQLSAGAPQGANPNDVRWLPTRTWPANITPMPPPTPTLIPIDDFPSTRYDRANTGRVPGAFRNNMVNPPPAFNGAQAAQGPSAPLIVVGPHVVLAANDGRIYTFDKNSTGNQLRAHPLNARVKFTLAAQDSIIYLVDDQNRITALDLTTNPARLIWQWPVLMPGGGAVIPQSGVTIAGNRLYIAADNGTKRMVLQYNRDNGQVLTPKFEVDGVNFQPFAIGHQLLYVAGNRLWALDLETLEVIWERDLATTTAPVYANNGVSALAELYVANREGRIFALDANTGQEIRNYDGSGEVVRNLALGNLQIYAVGSSFIKAYDRRNSNLLWRQATFGDTLSGPFVSSAQVFLITTGGQVQFFDPSNNGNPSLGPLAAGGAGAGAAVAGNYIFIPENGGRVVKLQEQQ